MKMKNSFAYTTMIVNEQWFPEVFETGENICPGDILTPINTEID